MPKYICSYAHDIACFTDFVMVAKNERAALRQIRKALREGKFTEGDATPAWENGSTNERVFVQGVASEHSPGTTLAELIGDQHRFGPATGRCVRCGQSASDPDAKTTPCRA